jgi:Cof subfamily protein (haloacid dehalogenase superfamily)
MASPIRLFISDVDGTLVRSDKSLAEATIAAVRRLREAGLPFTLISARPPSGMYWLAEALGIDLPMGAFNGGTLFRPDGHIIEQHHLPEDVARDALKRLDGPGVEIWVFADGKWFATEADGHHHAREVQAAQVDAVVTRDFSDLLPRIDKIVGVCDDEPLIMALERDLKAAYPGATVARSQPYYLDITSGVANKGDGVAFLAKAIGVELNDVAVAGDMANDLPMFARAGLSVAMGQGPDAVKQAAAFVTGPTDEDGLAAAITDLILPRLRA